jgi:hypothetical protein
MIDLDLNSGSFVTLPAVGGQTVDYTGVYQSPTFNIDMPLDLGETQEVWIRFHAGPIMQHLEIVDSDPVSLPNEGVIFDVSGVGDSSVNFEITMSGATGSYRQDLTTDVNVADQDVLGALGGPEPFVGGVRLGEFSSSFPNDPARIAGIPLDATQKTLSFQDVHLTLFNAGPNPIRVTALSFYALSNVVRIGESAVVPEPTSLFTWGGLIGIAGLVSSRRWA